MINAGIYSTGSKSQHREYSYRIFCAANQNIVPT